MIRSLLTLATLAFTLAFTAPLATQMAEGHGGHAEQLGRVRFATSCGGAAQSGVEHGVAYLHSFWYEKAAQAFDAAAAADSGCAMAFWGQAMSLLHPLWTPPSSTDARVAISAIDRGLARAKTTRERDYLGAIRVYYADYDRTDPRMRLVRYALVMDTVRQHSPSDREAAIFYALALVAHLHAARGLGRRRRVEHPFGSVRPCLRGRAGARRDVGSADARSRLPRVRVFAGGAR